MKKVLQKQKEKIKDFFFEEVSVSDVEKEKTSNKTHEQDIEKKPKVLNVRRTNNGFVFDILGENEDMIQGVFLSEDKVYDAENLRIKKLLKSEKMRRLSIWEDFIIFPASLILLVFLLNTIIDFILKIRG